MVLAHTHTHAIYLSPLRRTMSSARMPLRAYSRDAQLARRELNLGRKQCLHGLVRL